MQKIKQTLKSRTAILTEADMPAALLLVKSIADIALRYDTTEPMSAK